MHEDNDKTDWYEPDQVPVHNGSYEWENPQQFFEGDTHIEWHSDHWTIIWKTPFCSGRIVMQEAPCRWRGSNTPPIAVLLEL